MKETLGTLTKSHNSLKKDQDVSGQANIVGIPFHTLGGVKRRVYENVYDLSTQIHEALSSTAYTGKHMKKMDSGGFTFNTFLNKIGYTGDGKRTSKRKTFIFDQIPRRDAKMKLKSKSNLRNYKLKE